MCDAKRKTGTLYNALAYRRRCRRESTIKVADVEIGENEKQELHKFLKSCVLPKDRKVLEDTLVKYKDYRRSMIINDVDHYIEISDFYFVDPDLVSVFIHF